MADLHDGLGGKAGLALLNGILFRVRRPAAVVVVVVVLPAVPGRVALSFRIPGNCHGRAVDVRADGRGEGGRVDGQALVRLVAVQVQRLSSAYGPRFKLEQN